MAQLIDTRVRLTEADYEAAKAVAKSERTSMAAVIRRGLANELAKGATLADRLAAAGCSPDVIAAVVQLADADRLRRGLLTDAEMAAAEPLEA